ncbi:MAG: hypothetical protein ACT4PL_07980 [Phycisphaerales bacterium]
MARRVAILMLLAGLVAAWACTRPGVWLRHATIRAGYQLGEWAGVTPVRSAPGARLAGRVLGFNFHEPPPLWWLAVGLIGMGIMLAPALLTALWLARRLGTRPTAGRTPARPHWWNALASLATGTAVAFMLEWRCQRPTEDLIVRLGQSLGAHVVYMVRYFRGPDGPFTGEGMIDAVGNLVFRYGPSVLWVGLGSIAAFVAYSALRRVGHGDAISAHACTACGYDLGGTPAGGHCPECGAGGGPGRGRSPGT